VNPERWEQVKTVVGDALELPETERAAFISRACADDTKLRREVESMLSAPVANLEACAEHVVLARASGSNAMIGQRIGAYELISELGRGGMGAVYRARRADKEFEKEVAIKLLKRGTDTDEVLERFRAERQILARLEHPNIARLLDAGHTDEGLPYFVMEYVIGTRITDFCASNGLEVADRLRLFLKVCAAVQFAHQNLVVHRDIKPANILITPEGEPKLLDFGIAKLLETDGPVDVTAVDRQRFTLGYASPEQVRGEPITTVSDVYALGALLYELLAGASPHRFSTDRPSPTEILSVIAEREARRPSVVAVESQRARLRGDLDNIVLQALRKEPERRYPGVTALADDIRRYLENFPVRARKATIGYRTSKFVRRNRLGVALASLALLALLGGITIALWQAHIARVERAKAEQRFNQVRQLAHSVLFDYHDSIAALPGSTAVREKLVRDALQYLDNLSKEVGNDRSLLRELADAYEKVATVQGGVAASTGGVALSASNLGDSTGALASQSKALAIREQLANSDKSEAKDVKALAAAYAAMGNVYVFSGPPEKALEYTRKALTLIEPLLAADSGNEEVQLLAASTYLGMAKALGSPGGPNLGDTKGALEYMRKALALDERLAAEHPAKLGYQQGVASAHNILGLIFSAIGDTRSQLDEYQKALAIDKRLVEAEPGNTFYRRELAVQLGNTGSTMAQLKDKAGALLYFQEALAIYDTLVAGDPNDMSTRRQWAVAHRNVGATLGATDPAQASGNLQKAAQIFEELVARDPKNSDFRRQWAFTFLKKSQFETEIGNLEGAVASVSEGIKIDEALVAASPGNAAAQNTLALLFRQLGAAHVGCAQKVDLAPTIQGEHWRSARDAYAKCLEIYQAMKAKGILSGGDVNKPDEVARDITRCDEALK
jgi:serine/threonine protein kinase